LATSPKWAGGRPKETAMKRNGTIARFLMARIT
jgi:hypothetical protein